MAKFPDDRCPSEVYGPNKTKFRFDPMISVQGKGNGVFGACVFGKGCMINNTRMNEILQFRVPFPQRF